MPSSQASIDAIAQDASVVDVNLELLPDLDLPTDLTDVDSEHLLQDLPENFFNIDLSLPAPSSPPSSPYLGPTQPPARLASYIACHPYTMEPERHDLGPMNQICDSCGEASWKDKMPRWCCDAGKTKVAAPETRIIPINTDQDNDKENENQIVNNVLRESRLERDHVGFETTIDASINPDKAAINGILYSVTSGTSTFTNDCKEYR